MTMHLILSFLLELYFLPDQLCKSLHGWLELVLGSNAEGCSEILTRLGYVWLERLPGHQHDVLLHPPLHDHVPGRGQLRHLDPEEHAPKRNRIFTNTLQMFVSSFTHSVSSLLVELFNLINMVEESFMTPLFYQFACNHLTQRRSMKDTNL